MDWHQRFTQQATWTAPLRTYLFEKAGLNNSQKVLEVGCGTGAILADLNSPASVHGIDILPDRLSFAHKQAPSVLLTCADAHKLPYPDRLFDITFCHFLLLWVNDPIQVLREMKRVTRVGGAILALAEPDYTARRDEPPELVPLGHWQTKALQQQGADPAIGAKLTDLFSTVGIPCRESGVLQPGTRDEMTADELDLEWQVLESDLTGILPEEDIRKFKRLDRAAWDQHTRILYVPTHWAYGLSDGRRGQDQDKVQMV